jgi:hypothetical protein
MLYSSCKFSGAEAIDEAKRTRRRQRRTLRHANDFGLQQGARLGCDSYEEAIGDK